MAMKSEDLLLDDGERAPRIDARGAHRGGGDWTPPRVYAYDRLQQVFSRMEPRAPIEMDPREPRQWTAV